MFLVVKKVDPQDKPASHAFYALGFVFLLIQIPDGSRQP